MAAMQRYHVSCEPLRIFWNDDTTSSTLVPRVLPTTGWIPGFPASSGQHAWHSCRAGCIVFSENPQGLATHMVLNHRQSLALVWACISTFTFRTISSNNIRWFREKTAGTSQFLRFLQSTSPRSRFQRVFNSAKITSRFIWSLIFHRKTPQRSSLSLFCSDQGWFQNQVYNTC